MIREVGKIRIIPTAKLEKRLVTNFFMTHWGSPEMVLTSGIFQCDTLEGFAALNESGEILGLITFYIAQNECEIISLDSLEENKGIGTALVKQVEKNALNNACHKLKVVTTNDNIHALAFYQKRGFSMIKVFPNAVEHARKIKPEIPLVAENGIPIRDEILLGKDL